VIGCRSAQAVGQALKKNPDAPRVPCHRVVSSDMRVGGFFGSLTDPRKREMLEAEGVIFIGDKISKDSIHHF
jgi:methylated-DNA-[protein]-cysteine S-methyltransferase